MSIKFEHLCKCTFDDSNFKPCKDPKCRFHTKPKRIVEYIDLNGSDQIFNKTCKCTIEDLYWGSCKDPQCAARIKYKF